MDYLNKIKILTKYREGCLDNKEANISYLYFKEITFHEAISEAKQIFREKSIKYLNNEIDDETYNKCKEELENKKNESVHGNLITSEMKTLKLNPKPLISYNLIYKKVIDIINNISIGNKKINNITLKDVNKANHNDKDLFELILYQINYCQNMMLYDRASFNSDDITTLIIGTDLIPIMELGMSINLNSPLNRFEIIYDKYIDKNKIIILKNNDTNINLIIDDKHNNYYLSDTEITYKNLAWFKII